MLQALERADRHTELLALGDVTDPDGQRAETEAHERRRGEHPPLVERLRVEPTRVVARGHHLTVGQPAVGEGGRGEVGHEVSGWRRDDDELVTV